jgi:hypothetical protein
MLSPGVHDADWLELTSRFGGNLHRQTILQGVRQALRVLAQAGCGQVWVDGSFITNKPYPSDWDGCWDPVGVDPARLEPAFLEFTAAARQQMKTKYMADLFPASFSEASSGLFFVQYFQRDKVTGDPKGIVRIDLTGGSP